MHVDTVRMNTNTNVCSIIFYGTTYRYNFRANQLLYEWTFNIMTVSSSFLLFVLNIKYYTYVISLFFTSYKLYR